MNEQDFDQRLADYLGGELDEQQAAALRAELEADPQRRRLACELHTAAAALETGLLSPEEAERRTASLACPADAARGAASATGRGRRWAAGRPGVILRYAAVIVAAFGLGYLARGWREAERSVPALPAVRTAEVNDAYVAGFMRATKAFPESSTFSRALLMLARR